MFALFFACWITFNESDGGLNRGAYESQSGRRPIVAALPTDRAATTAQADPRIRAIHASWKARQQQAQSLHFRWRIGVITRRYGLAAVELPFGQNDGERAGRPVRYDLSAPEFWLSGSRFQCRELHQHLPAASGRENRTVGEFLSPGPRTLGMADTRRRVGLKYTQKFRTTEIREIAPIMLSYRPLEGEVGAWRFVTDNAIVGRQHLTKIEKRTEYVARNLTYQWIETFWLDPQRQNLLIHWEERSLRNAPASAISFEYEQDPKFGWVPAGWILQNIQPRSPFASEALNCSVVDYAINEPSPPEFTDPMTPFYDHVTEAIPFPQARAVGE